jgi:hypothetical protein
VVNNATLSTEAADFMVTSKVDANIHYRHSLDEVEELSRAVIPLRDSIVAVSTGLERGKMHAILRGDYFRYRDAERMRAMLVRAIKYQKMHLGEYFPEMRAQVLLNTRILEEETKRYWNRFSRLAEETTPVH